MDFQRMEWANSRISPGESQGGKVRLGEALSVGKRPELWTPHSRTDYGRPSTSEEV